MSTKPPPRVGQIIWRDLTVPDAGRVRDFYRDVVGWEATPHPMGEYDDYDIRLPGGDGKGEVVTGVCHARGTNANVPPQWLMYVWIADVNASAERCVAGGGTVLDGPRRMGGQLFCVIQDPAGAVLALMSEAPGADAG